MRVLITGGAGFIGSHLTERHLEMGDEVYIIDDLSTGAIKNIEHLKTYSKFHYFIDTVTNHSLIAELVDLADIIYHLAAAVGVKLIVESTVRTVETNIKGTETILHYAAKKKKRVLITSTSEVYGKTTKIPFSEDDDLVIGATNKGRWSYACSKAIDEFLAIAYWKEKQVPTVIARLFNTVGPRQSGQYGMVIPGLVDQALAGMPITVFGDGSQSRCFTHVNDAITALVALNKHPQAVGEVYNVGSTNEITINQLAARIKVLTNSNAEIIHVPYEQAYKDGFEDMQRRVPSIEKVVQLTGFAPTYSLDQIINSVIEYRSNRDRLNGAN